MIDKSPTRANVVDKKQQEERSIGSNAIGRRKKKGTSSSRKDFAEAKQQARPIIRLAKDIDKKSTRVVDDKITRERKKIDRTNTIDRKKNANEKVSVIEKRF